MEGLEGERKGFAGWKEIGNLEMKKRADEKEYDDIIDVLKQRVFEIQRNHRTIFYYTETHRLSSKLSPPPIAIFL